MLWLTSAACTCCSEYSASLAAVALLAGTLQSHSNNAPEAADTCRPRLQLLIPYQRLFAALKLASTACICLLKGSLALAGCGAAYGSMLYSFWGCIGVERVAYIVSLTMLGKP